MGKVFLAANFVTASESYLTPSQLEDSGHLQIIYLNDAGVFEEIEVQAPGWRELYGIGDVSGGNWQYTSRANHGEAPDDADYVGLDGVPTDEARYARVEISPGEGQTAEQLWAVLNSIFQSMSSIGSNVDYDYIPAQNSNSFVTSALYAAGINVGDYIFQVMPEDVQRFPGVATNVLMSVIESGTLSEDGLSVNFAGTDGNDFLRGGNNDDLIAGGAGTDRIVGGMGDDTIYASFLIAPYDEAGDYITSGQGKDEIFLGKNTVSGSGEVLMTWNDDVEDLVFNEGSRGSYDIIRDFEQLEDTVTVSTYVNGDFQQDYVFDSYTLTSDGYQYGDREVFVADFGTFSLSAIEDEYFDEFVGDVIKVLVFFYNFSSLFLEPIFGLQISGPIVELVGASSGVRAAEGTPDGDIITGSIGDDVLYGRGGDDTIVGDAGNDKLFGGAGADSLSGGDGDDEIYADEQDIWFSGGAGIDTLFFAGTSALAYSLAQGDFENVRSGSGDDTIWGTEADNIIDGGSGDDTLFGYGGNDVIIGGAGADSLMGGEGDDEIHADADDVWFSGGAGTDTLFYHGEDNRDLSLEQGEFENIRAGTGSNIVWGTDQDNVMLGEGGDDTLFGYGGNDLIIGGEGADSLMGGDGNDEIHADAEDTWFSGGDGIDTLVYTGSNNFQYALAQGSFENVRAGAGDNTIWGTSAANVIDGEAGADTLFGDEGDDTLIGGAGADELSGGLGDDVFVFRANFGQDTVVDFQAGASSEDVIEFQNALFSNFAEVLAASNQVGSDTLITYDVDNVITLSNVALTSLHQDDFRFVA
ncbi:calcium-binding protein [Rhizobium rhizophilum]|uniref:Calcium-binding protein n=1 Tax=Rhizobium rhizophilum TaxID=1850373 RepID=A0ABY2QRV0_9HYPH|nr:calcium-binding protein [Rhizobium rhizophilum]THV12708.1 calcium-binding protein [Rhizobium rhizophilum]